MSEILEKCCIPPRLTEKCATANESGGISRIIFAACDVNFNDINNVAEWCYLVKQGKIIVTNEILGKKDKANYTTKMVSSCRPEVVTGKTNTVTYTDYLLDNQEYRDVKFYNTIQKNARHYKLGFIKCDGKFYGLIDKFSVKIDKVIEDTVNACTYWDIELSWNGLESSNPINIPNLLDYLNAQCKEVANFDIADIYSNNDSITMDYNYYVAFSSTFPTTQFIDLNAIFNGLKVNGVFDSYINENGYFNINAPYVLGAKYYYGNIYVSQFYDIISGQQINYVGPPITVSESNNIIEYNPYPIITGTNPNVYGGFDYPVSTRIMFKYVAIRDYDIEDINQDLTDFLVDINGVRYTDGVNYLYLYECMNDLRPALTIDASNVNYLSSNNIPGLITNFAPCFKNGYNQDIKPYFFYVNEYSILTTSQNLANLIPVEYQLQINGVPSNWKNYNVNGINDEVPTGNHILLLRNTSNGFLNIIPFTLSCP